MSNIFNIGFCLLQRPPLYVPIGWAVFFICGHSIQISRLLWEHRPLDLDPHLSNLFEKAFRPWGFKSGDFLQIIARAPPETVQTVSAGELLAEQDDEISSIHYLLEGQLQVEQDGIVLNVISPGPGGWVGEFWGPEYDWISREHKWRVSFRCLDRCRTVGFDKRDLHQAIQDMGPPGELAASKMQIHDLRSKLHVQRKHHHAQMYSMMLIKCTQNGRLSDEDRTLLENHRKLHPDAIPEDDHKKRLKALGWTEADYARGYVWQVVAGNQLD
eukprot:TRINITY_DN108962_c0_g1_i1.p1 TRINITY_DN108962_c0_g1~~TRINITY_DN108962_c0_g1_i1.p1  ORF type:complete len:301 (-),score=42.52 TRINITY_DN108962_c0_g1_i1:23-835(-)